MFSYFLRWYNKSNIWMKNENINFKFCKHWKSIIYFLIFYSLFIVSLFSFFLFYIDTYFVLRCFNKYIIFLKSCTILNELLQENLFKAMFVIWCLCLLVSMKYLLYVSILFWKWQLRNFRRLEKSLYSKGCDTFLFSDPFQPSDGCIL